MHRYFVQLCFKGTNYHGWQIQPNAITVQGIVENAFSTILREEINVVGAGRTDTGVHASFYVLHFDINNEIINPQSLVYKINSLLPRDVAIEKIWKVTNKLHARFSAISRTYKYFIVNKKDPFNIDTTYYYRRELNIDKMNKAADVLKDYCDFTSFSKLHTDVKTNFCKVYYAKWIQNDKQLVFTIKADRFLRNMVRAIVGTLLEIGIEKITVEQFENIIEQKNRSMAGASVPAQGLFLVDVKYPDVRD